MIAGKRKEETAGLKRSGEVGLILKSTTVELNYLFTFESSLLIKDPEQ